MLRTGCFEPDRLVPLAPSLDLVGDLPEIRSAIDALVGADQPESDEERETRRRRALIAATPAVRESAQPTTSCGTSPSPVKGTEARETTSKAPEPAGRTPSYGSAPAGTGVSVAVTVTVPASVAAMTTAPVKPYPSTSSFREEHRAALRGVAAPPGASPGSGHEDLGVTGPRRRVGVTLRRPAGRCRRRSRPVGARIPGGCHRPRGSQVVRP